MQDQGGRDMTQAVSDTPRTDAVLSSDHYAKDLLELARTLERELAALRDRLARLPSDTPLVYLTALEHENDSLRALREGVPRELEADARRYRWLRARLTVTEIYGGRKFSHLSPLSTRAVDGEYREAYEIEIDRMIDKCAAAQEGTP
jgi:hypothetical protein